MIHLEGFFNFKKVKNEKEKISETDLEMVKSLTQDLVDSLKDIDHFWVKLWSDNKIYIGIGDITDSRNGVHYTRKSFYKKEYNKLINSIEYKNFISNLERKYKISFINPTGSAISPTDYIVKIELKLR